MVANTTYCTLVSLSDVDWGFSHKNPLPRSLGLYSIIGAFTALALWSAIPLTMRLLFTFQRYQGLYFWSILVTTWGLSLRSLGLLLKYTVPTCPWVLSGIFQEVGWVAMVSGFSVVLYSRLSLLVESKRTLRFILAIIIVDGVCLHTTTIAWQFIYLSQPKDSPSKQKWITSSAIIERVQAVWFTVQQLIIALLYVKAAWDYLQDRLQQDDRARKVMLLLIVVQVVETVIDIVIVVLECAGYFVAKMIIHSFVYSIKLELEFVILNQIVLISRLATPGQMSVPVGEPDAEFAASLTPSPLTEQSFKYTNGASRRS